MAELFLVFLASITVMLDLFFLCFICREEVGDTRHAVEEKGDNAPKSMVVMKLLGGDGAVEPQIINLLPATKCFSTSSFIHNKPLLPQVKVNRRRST